jgi:hypothetical protein
MDTKHPEVAALIASLQSERSAILAKSQPHRDLYNALAAQIAPIEAEQRNASEQFFAIERPRLGEIDNQLSALNRAIGGRFVSDGAELPEP